MSTSVATGIPVCLPTHSSTMWHCPGCSSILARHGVRATFFILARGVPHEVARLASILDAGHEVASHGIDHLAAMAGRTGDEIRAELEDLGGAWRPIPGIRSLDFAHRTGRPVGDSSRHWSTPATDTTHR